MRWIDEISSRKRQRTPYENVLNAIWTLHKERGFESVTYSSLATALDFTESLKMPREDVKEICKALSRMAPQYIFARDNCVELEQRPDKVMEAIKAVIGEYPDEEQEGFML